jgi:hypothetical protein
MDEAAYKAFKKRFGGYGSWALWDEADLGNLAVIEKNIGKLHTGYVFVGLTPSRTLAGQEPWRNYHYPHQGGKEKALHTVLGNSVYAGSYMTDIFKDPAAATAAFAAAHTGDTRALAACLKQCFAALEGELAALAACRPVKKLFLFGGTALALWNGYAAEKHYPRKGLTHFAARGGQFLDNIYGELGIRPPRAPARKPPRAPAPARRSGRSRKG